MGTTPAGTGGATAPDRRARIRGAQGRWARTRGAQGRWARVDGAAGGLAADLALYALSAGFAGLTALTSTLLPHRAWGAVACWGYAAATVAVTMQLVLRRRVAGGGSPAPASPGPVGRPGQPLEDGPPPSPGAALAGPAGRIWLAWLTWGATTALPLIMQAVQRATGRTDRAQEEVVVVEQGGWRLLHDGTPYLGRAAIAALAEPERLLGYLPYQPGMALFGLPRAAGATAWYGDARVWFALVTVAAIGLATRQLRPGRAPDARQLSGPAGIGRRGPGWPTGPAVRAVQSVTVLPLCALTLATGGDDLPVLGCCLLALALFAAARPGAAGLAAGLAGALKLFAWPVTVVLAVAAVAAGRGPAGRFLGPALGLPLAALLPALLVDPGSLAENVVRFPLGHGLVTSPAQSPFPGHLIAEALPAGRGIAAALLALSAAGIGVALLRRPPRSAGAAARYCGLGLLAAILLMPSTRFGYLLYPAALLLWAPVLDGRPATGAAGRPGFAAGEASAPAPVGVHLEG